MIFVLPVLLETGATDNMTDSELYITLAVSECPPGYLSCGH